MFALSASSDQHDSHVQTRRDHKEETRRASRELTVCRKLVRLFILAECTVSVFDSEEWTLKNSDDLDSIVSALRTTCEDRLSIRFAGVRIGTIYLVYGNSPEEVVADYSVGNDRFDSIMAKFDEWIEAKESAWY